MTLTLTHTEAKDELAKLHGVKSNDIVIIGNEQDLDASFFTNLRAGQKSFAIKILRDQFPDLKMKDALDIVNNFCKIVFPDVAIL